MGDLECLKYLFQLSPPFEDGIFIVGLNTNEGANEMSIMNVCTLGKCYQLLSVAHLAWAAAIRSGFRSTFRAYRKFR